MHLFAKYQAAGNDFIVIDDRKNNFSVEQGYISKLCHRRFGIGADGLILLQTSTTAHFRMRIFNADGKEAALCGNGLRCLADFIHKNGLHSSHLILETKERLVECHVEKESIRVDLGTYEWRNDFAQSGFSFQSIHTGVPHAVAFVDSIETAEFSILAHLRYHPVWGEEGSNINIAEMRNHEVYIRTCERGVGETLACGTGAAAVAIAAQKKFDLPNPVCIVPRSEEKLYVEVTPDKVFLSGKATLVFLGTIA